MLLILLNIFNLGVARFVCNNSICGNGTLIISLIATPLPVCPSSYVIHGNSSHLHHRRPHRTENVRAAVPDDDMQRRRARADRGVYRAAPPLQTRCAA